jgi:hypothetical protein
MLKSIYTLAIGLSLFLSGSFSSLGAVQATYYISPTGSDANNGLSAATPFATLTKAQTVVRTINSSMTGNIMVYVMQGDYVVTSTVIFTSADSGTGGFNVIYTNYNANGSARLLAGTKVTGWLQYSNNIYRANIGTGLGFTTLYENGIRADMARWPKRTSAFATSRAGYLTYVSTSGNQFVCTDNSYSPSGNNFNPAGKDFSKAYMYGWHGSDGHRWSGCEVPITSVAGSPPGNITINVSTTGGLGSPPDSCLIENCLGLLEVPGEYFYDSSSGYLYYYSRFSGPIANQEIIAPRVVRLIYVNGSSNLQFAGLTLMDTDRIIQSSTDDWFDTQQAGYDATIYMVNAQNVVVRNCKISGSGINGVTLDSGTAACTITGCLIEHTGYHGVNLKGGSGHTISNCLIRYCGELRGHGRGVNVLSDPDTLANLEVYYCARAGVCLGVANGFGGSTVSYVRVHDCVQDSGDQGGFYHISSAGNTAYFQCLSYHNYVDPSCGDRPPTAVYTDRGSSGTIGTSYTDVEARDSQFWMYRHDPQYTDSTLLTYTNCSWDQGGYVASANQWTDVTNAADTNQMQYSLIGVTSNFPAEYNDLLAGPAAPINLWAQPGNAAATLRWTEVDRATSYLVKRATTSGGPYTIAATNPVPVTGYDLGTTYVANNLTNGVTYYYIVTATNAAGESPVSLEVKVTPNTNCPARLNGALIGTVASAANAVDGNLLTWTADSGGWVGLDLGKANVISEIRYAPSYQGGGLQGGDSIAWLGAGGQFQGDNDPGFNAPTTLFKVSFSKSGSHTPILIPTTIFNTNAFRYVRYVPGASHSEIGEIQFFGDKPASVALTAPTNFTATIIAGNMGLNWNAVNGALTYTVKRSTNNGSGYMTIAGNLETTNYTDSSFVRGITNYYVVTATNNDFESPNSMQVSAFVGVPTPPVSLVATPGSGLIGLSWTVSSGAASYNVKRSIASGGSYTTIASPTTTNYTDTAVVNGVIYYYVVSSANSYGESTNSVQVSATPGGKLNGAVIGTAGSYNNSGNTIAKVFDGDLTTYFDAAAGTGAWAGLDFGLGVSNRITQIKYCPRSGYPQRMTGGVFQGGTDPNFTNPVTLFSITVQPPTGVMTVQPITNTIPFQYVRYLGPNNGNCNVAEVEFDGYTVAAPAAPTGLTATAGDAQVVLNWSAISGAAVYKVKNSTVSGGGYTVVASNSGLAFTNIGLANGTMYYFVVSATNAVGEGANSVQVSARPVSGAATSLAFALNGSQLQLSWPADHTGWLLQMQTSSVGAGLGLNWITVTDTDTTNQLNVPLDASNGSVFFRLVSP